MFLAGLPRSFALVLIVGLVAEACGPAASSVSSPPPGSPVSPGAAAELTVYAAASLKAALRGVLQGRPQVRPCRAPFAPSLALKALEDPSHGDLQGHHLHRTVDLPTMRAGMLRAMKRVAFLGLGRMGSAMASRLLARGYDVAVYNRTAARAEALVAAGARLAATPRAACAGTDAVVAMVADDVASRTMWLGQDGALAAELQRKSDWRESAGCGTSMRPSRGCPRLRRRGS